jgi:hypothetical protein
MLTSSDATGCLGMGNAAMVLSSISDSGRARRVARSKYDNTRPGSLPLVAAALVARAAAEAAAAAAAVAAATANDTLGAGVGPRERNDPLALPGSVGVDSGVLFPVATVVFRRRDEAGSRV